MQILVVEDDRKIASFVVKGLKEAGFAVDHADNREDGLQMVLSTSHDAAVMDVMLPKLDGLSLIERFLRWVLRYCAALTCVPSSLKYASISFPSFTYSTSYVILPLRSIFSIDLIVLPIVTFSMAALTAAGT
jgi:two-component SAPR family response regulator